MKIKIILYNPSEEERKKFWWVFLGHGELTDPDPYLIRLEDEKRNTLYTFPEPIYYNFWEKQICQKDWDSIQEKLKEYDNPETEIIFDNSESND